MPITLGPHATGSDRNQVLCSCPDLGCAQKTIEYRGKIHQGRIFSRQSYPKHLRQVVQLPPHGDVSATNQDPPSPMASNPAAPPALGVNPSSTLEEIQAPPTTYASAIHLPATILKCVDSIPHISWP